MRKLRFVFFVKIEKAFCFVSILTCVLFNNAELRAQDLHFSQFYMSPLTQNPAMAGANYDMQAIVNYKDQWQSVTTPYKTLAASFDMRLTNKKARKGFWAAGINIFNDQAGDAQMSLLQANLNVAYHIHLDGYNTLGAGVQGGFAQRSINFGALQWGNQYNGMAYDPGLGSGEALKSSLTATYMDLGAGIVWAYANTSGSKNVTDNHDLKINLGASVFHPQEPKYSFFKDGEKLYAKFVLHGDALISVPGSSLAIVPGLMYYRQGSAQEIYAGSMLRFKFKQDSKYTGFHKGAAMSVGAYYREGDGVAAALLLEYSNYAIGFSYDINSSLLKTASSFRGGMEISLRFVTPNPFLNKPSSSILYQP
jgi:type IX secretion system PorP/SprF family membrane protein